MLDVGEVRRLAAREGWTEVQFNQRSAVLGFKRQDQRVNVYYTTGTVGTCLDHPRAGKTQLFRRNRTLADLAKIFKNPRQHSGAGYYRRHSWQRAEPSQAGRLRLWCCLRSGALTDQLCDGWRDEVETLALGSGYFVVERDGQTWWADVPTALHNKVVGRQKSLPPVDYVALGGGGRWFVQFTDGNWWLVGPQSLHSALCGSDSAVEILAFAPDDGWYVLWEDGSSAWEGLPTRLHNKLNGRQRSLPGVESLSVGPNAEWFVRFADGSWRANGLPDDCSDTVADLQRQGRDIARIVFGDDDAWAVLFT